MVVTLLFVLFICALGILHTYLLYPWLTIRAAGRRCKVIAEVSPTSLPSVHLFMAVHNEAAILERKLATLERQDYAGELTFHLASDASTDASPDLLQQFAAACARRVTLQLSPTRRGKPATVNRLVQSAQPAADGVLIFTDASVLLRPDTVSELVRPMVIDGQIGVVDSVMVHTGTSATAISETEAGYIDREVRLKRAESVLWRYMMGPFGGCFALRSAAYAPVPANFLVDDFYHCMAAYARGWHGVTASRAVVTEAVGQQLSGEFRRKRRIGAGNWQNLVHFRRLWWPPTGGPLAYALFSHKVLRWLTPLLGVVMVAAWVGVVLLSGNYWAAVTFAVLVVITGLVFALPPLLAPLGIPGTRVRALRYFLAMNVALLLGFLRYLTGIKTNVWQPTDRSPHPPD